MVVRYEFPYTVFRLYALKQVGKAIEDMGFEEPSPIQALAIPLIQAGRDVTAQAQTGTGKTAAFGIPVIEKIDPAHRVVQAIVLCPTRELAIQIAEEFSNLLAHLPRIIGPADIRWPADRTQLRALQTGVHIVIGTPGRVMDHLRPPHTHPPTMSRPSCWTKPTRCWTWDSGTTSS